MSGLVCTNPARHGWSRGVCKVNLDQLAALMDRRGKKWMTTGPTELSACWKRFSM